VGVDAQREGRVAVAEVFGELLDRDTASEHDAGVVVTELVDAFLAGGDIAAATTAVPDGCGDQAGLGHRADEEDRRRRAVIRSLRCILRDPAAELAEGQQDDAIGLATERFQAAVATAGLPPAPVVRTEAISETEEEDDFQ